MPEMRERRAQTEWMGWYSPPELVSSLPWGLAARRALGARPEAEGGLCFVRDGVSDGNKIEPGMGSGGVGVSPIDCARRDRRALHSARDPCAAIKPEHQKVHCDNNRYSCIDGFSMNAGRVWAEFLTFFKFFCWGSGKG